jgi:hypothetical protein
MKPTPASPRANSEIVAGSGTVAPGVSRSMTSPRRLSNPDARISPLSFIPNTPSIYKKILADEGMKKRDLILAQDSFFSKAMGKPWCLPVKFRSLVASDEASGFKEDYAEGNAQQREGRPGYCDSQRKH